MKKMAKLWIFLFGWLCLNQFATNHNDVDAWPSVLKVKFGFNGLRQKILSNNFRGNFFSSKSLNSKPIVQRPSRNFFSKISSKCKPFAVAVTKLPLSLLLTCLILPRAFASVGVVSTPSTKSGSPFQGLLLWASLFLLSAALHSAESAITKISPWKVAWLLVFICGLI